MVLSGSLKNIVYSLRYLKWFLGLKKVLRTEVGRKWLVWFVTCFVYSVRYATLDKQKFS